MDEPGRSQFDKQLAHRFDAVRHEARPQAAAGPPRNDGQQFVAPAQGGLAARYVHVGARAIVRGGDVDAALDLFQREVAHGLRRFAQTTQRAVQVAALRQADIA